MSDTVRLRVTPAGHVGTLDGEPPPPGLSGTWAIFLSFYVAHEAWRLVERDDVGFSFWEARVRDLLCVDARRRLGEFGGWRGDADEYEAFNEMRRALWPGIAAAHGLRVEGFDLHSTSRRLPFRPPGPRGTTGA